MSLGTIYVTWALLDAGYIARELAKLYRIVEVKDVR